jgi:sulfur carrier protein ThiS|tara:strand:+ start:563 stop:757 length:195 start_codon:yes stop_codon:yes gene_type:complete
MPTVHLEKENKTIETKNLVVRDILKELNINPTTIIITKNNELILETTKLQKQDKITVLPVISGG